MAENVIFDNQQANPAGDDPNAQVQSGGEGESPDGADYSDESGPDDSGTPPPSGIKGILSSLLSRKKILIGIFAAIILIVVVIILIIPKNQTPKEASLVWWGLWEDANVMKSIIDDFEKQHPNIKISYSKQDPDKYRDTLLTRIKNGTGPDIFRYHNTWVPGLSAILSPLPKDVITVADFSKNYYPVTQNDLIQNGAIYGIPLGIDSIALFVNDDMLDSAGISVPVDWNQFVSAAKELTEKDPDTKDILVSGAALGTYGNINHAPDIISLMFLQQGVDTKKLPEAAENLNAALSFYTSFSKGSNSVWNNTLDNSQIEFARGKLAMYFGFSWDIFAIDQIKSNTKLNYSVHPVPGLLEGQNITVASYWTEGVSSRSKHQKEAMIFMRYLSQKETLQKLYTEASKTRRFGPLYPRVDMANELKDNELIYPFISHLGQAGSSYFAGDTHDEETGLNKRANTYLENAINAIVQENSSIETEIETLTAGVTKVLKENGIQ
jgi:multiple sugar transport system substrate-binding protein